MSCVYVDRLLAGSRLDTKCVVQFSVQFLSETLFILRRIERNINTVCWYVDRRVQLDATQWYIELVSCSICFGHYYEGCSSTSPRTHSQQPHTRPTANLHKVLCATYCKVMYSLKLLMIGIIVPETC
jgi:hypothetical protein